MLLYLKATLLKWLSGIFRHLRLLAFRKCMITFAPLDGTFFSSGSQIKSTLPFLTTIEAGEYPAIPNRFTAATRYFMLSWQTSRCKITEVSDVFKKIKIKKYINIYIYIKFQSAVYNYHFLLCHKNVLTTINAKHSVHALQISHFLTSQDNLIHISINC